MKNLSIPFLFRNLATKYTMGVNLNSKTNRDKENDWVLSCTNLEIIGTVSAIATYFSIFFKVLLLVKIY